MKTCWLLLFIGGIVGSLAVMAGADSNSLLIDGIIIAADFVNPTGMAAEVLLEVF